MWHYLLTRRGRGFLIRPHLGPKEGKMKTEPRYCPYCGGEKEFQVLKGTENAVLWGSSHAVLRESSHAELCESSHAVLRGSSHAVGSKYSSIALHGQTVHAKGGMQIKIPEILTAKEWCDYYGVEVKKGIATLFKAVDDDYSTLNARSKGIFYTPGSMPIAPDWDGGKAECGGGL